MFDDPQKELKRLENKLMESEQSGKWLDDELEEAHRLLGDRDYDQQPTQDLDATQVFRRGAAPVRNYANGYGQGVNYHEQYDYDDGYRDEEDEQPRSRGIAGLVVLALGETAAIVGIILYWVLKLL